MMAGLVEAIQGDALNPAVNVSTLLRKVKLAASKLNLGSAVAWVDAELNGYSGDVPEYRIMTGQPKVYNPYNGWIPIAGDPATVRGLSKVRCGQTVAEIEDLLNAKEGSDLHSPLPPEVVNALNREIGVSFGQASVMIGRSELAGILDAVRNKVLDWAIELEKQGISGEGLSFSQDEKSIARESGHSIYIHSVGNITGNVGTGNTSGDISSALNEGAVFERLAQRLSQSVADATTRQELLTAVKQMSEAQDNQSAFAAAYGRFMSLAADHMTVVLPFLPALTALLG